MMNADWRSLARAWEAETPLRHSLSRAVPVSRELLALTTALLEGAGYVVLPARSIALGELAEHFDLAADPAGGLRLLVAVAPMGALEHRLHAIESSRVLTTVRRNGWAAEAIGWRQHGSGWKCRRVGMVMQTTEGELFTNSSEPA